MRYKSITCKRTDGSVASFNPWFIINSNNSPVDSSFFFSCQIIMIKTTIYLFQCFCLFGTQVSNSSTHVSERRMPDDGEVVSLTASVSCSARRQLPGHEQTSERGKRKHDGRTQRRCELQSGREDLSDQARGATGRSPAHSAARRHASSVSLFI